MKQLLLLLIVAAAQAIPATAQSREKGLDNWLDHDLIPYVKQQLVKHPRFQGETVMFVVLSNNLPASSSNTLALSLRDRVLEASVHTSGVSIGWQQGRTSAALESAASDCLQDPVRYYVGVEVAQELDSRYTVKLRALDLADKTWVAGFGKQWRGELTTIQRQAMRQQRFDETLIGSRDLPFTAAQTDLLATHLAHQLSCSLKQTVSGDYVVRAKDADITRRENPPPAHGLEATVELIGNNLANQHDLLLTSNTSTANAVMTGKAHPIDGMLYQYWLTVTPLPHHDNLTALSASAYILLPENSGSEKPVLGITLSNTTKISTMTEQTEAVSKTLPKSISVPNAGSDALLNSLTITAPKSSTECRYPCSMLRSTASTDSIIFVLQHQANQGLVRLAGGVCRQRTAAILVRSGDTLDFPIARNSAVPRQVDESLEWLLQPQADTYYAIAVTDSNVARQLANHIDKLPLRCSNSFRPGLSGAALRDWLSEFAIQASKLKQQFDWRAVQVRNLT